MFADTDERESRSIPVEPGTTVDPAKMRGLIDTGKYTQLPYHIGGHGVVLHAEPQKPYTGPRYEFDPMKQRWFAC